MATMKKRNTYTCEYKARVVLEYMKGTKSLIELANIYNVHPSLIKNWKSYFLKQAIRVFEDRRRNKRTGKGTQRNISEPVK